MGAGSYTIEYCDGVDCDPNATIQILDGLTTDHTITPLLSNTIYRIHIRATHTTASLSSPYSSIISTRTKLSTPSNFRTTAQTSTTIALAWSAVTGADGYEIQYCDGSGCTLDQTEVISSGSTNTHTLTGLTANTTYRFKVKSTGIAPEVDSVYSSPILDVTTNS